VFLSSFFREYVCAFVAGNTGVALDPPEFGRLALGEELLNNVPDGIGGGLAGAHARVSDSGDGGGGIEVHYHALPAVRLGVSSQGGLDGRHFGVVCCLFMCHVPSCPRLCPIRSLQRFDGAARPGMTGAAVLATGSSCEVQG